MSRSLEGKVAVVTGSGQGIGKGIAVGLAREGAKVITNNRKKGSGSLKRYNKAEMPEEDWKKMVSLAGDAESTAEIIKAEGGEAIPFFGDVSKPEVAEELVRTAIDTWGTIDIIVNNAAGLGTGSITSLTEEQWDYMTVSRSSPLHDGKEIRQDIQLRFGCLGRASGQRCVFHQQCRSSRPYLGRCERALQVWHHRKCILPSGGVTGPCGGLQQNAQTRKSHNRKRSRSKTPCGCGKGPWRPGKPGTILCLSGSGGSWKHQWRGFRHEIIRNHREILLSSYYRPGSQT